jgi:ATP-binding cassette subfamily F protein uup
MGGAEWFADYAQWEAAQAKKASEERRPSSPRDRARPSSHKRKGFSYNEQKEWDQIEAKILAAERMAAASQAAVSDPAIVSSAEVLQERYAALHAAQAEVERLYKRWAELDEKRAQLIGGAQL